MLRMCYVYVPKDYRISGAPDGLDEPADDWPDEPPDRSADCPAELADISPDDPPDEWLDELPDKSPDCLAEPADISPDDPPDEPIDILADDCEDPPDEPVDMFINILFGRKEKKITYSRKRGWRKSDENMKEYERNKAEISSIWQKNGEIRKKKVKCTKIRKHCNISIFLSINPRMHLPYHCFHHLAEKPTRIGSSTGLYFK